VAVFALMDPMRNRRILSGTWKQRPASKDPLFHAIVDNVPGKRWAGVVYADRPKHRCLEVGSILYSPALQRSAAATEAMYLMARHVFETLGYRRYEWSVTR